MINSKQEIAAEIDTLMLDNKSEVKIEQNDKTYSFHLEHDGKRYLKIVFKESPIIWYHIYADGMYIEIKIQEEENENHSTRQERE